MLGSAKPRELGQEAWGLRSEKCPAVLQLASQEARYKAFGTCVSHIGAILAFYTPVVISSVMHRVARQAAPHVHILLANFYLLFPPMVNPIIYGVKTKQIRERVLGLFLRKDVQEVTTVMNRANSSVDIAKMAVKHLGLAALLRGVLYIGPLPIMIRLRLPLYRTKIITHSYCEHMAVVTLACGDTTVNNVYGMGIGFLVLILDSLAITASYVMIFRTAVLQLASQEARYKAFGTCVSHLGAILSTYTPVVISSVMHRVAQQAAPHVHILLAIVYLLFPPMVNPIIYGVKTKQIRDHVLSLFWRKNV
ncbi:hypothetical protein MG293_012350 [Ovis ammon polii]|uniref:G-protein coupled receptors family 1 profile domain-containing protein n=1 Tax=Ovis ammon polii TaxID=230172 RepID=A0AAD4U390_OVIAM|nr:hypothetical protein MG293_012350 [Ovis ammon polii]